MWKTTSAVACTLQPWLEDEHRSAHRLYNTEARRGKVWARLVADGTARHCKPHRQYDFVEGTTAPATLVRNGYGQGVPVSTTVIPSGLLADRVLDPPLATLHPTTLERYRREEPQAFYSAIRPKTQTMTQTLRYVVWPPKPW